MQNMGLKAAVQALKKAEPLKDKVQRCKDLLNDNDAWVCQQQLQKIYQQVLILDLEYALDKKVEQELWNLGFKNYIATLQSQAKDRKNPKRGESQALLSWCLEAASGFYLTLLQEICTAFDLDLPFRRKGYVYGCTSPWKAVEKLSAPHKSSCFYACQYCLVHLGDIARYRNENKQAELFYRHAVSLSPSSGQPYNQLALLEASRGDKLGTVFHYARSVAVKHPFPVAAANLAKTLSSALNDSSFNVNGKTKLNSQEYIAVFLKLHGVIHNLGDLKIAPIYVKLLTETLTALVATESFSSWMLVQMLVINLYALQHIAGGAMDSTELLKIEQLSSDEKVARDCILDLIAGSLSALLLPVYTIKNSIVDYFALPSIKLCLDWIRIKPTVLEEVAFTSRLQIWPSLCVLLNALQNCVVDFKYDQYTKVPLPEDRDLQGFLPLEKSFENLRFTNTDLEDDVTTLNKLRAVRILYVGHCLAQYRVDGSALISVTTGGGKTDNRFTSTSDPGPSNELMKELEELSLSREKQPINTSTSPVLSETSSKASTDIDVSESTEERRAGILKPQGSLERSRDSVTNNVENSTPEANVLPSTRKPRQNIAMQAIMRRAETEQKQVTFKSISPVMIVEEREENKGKASSDSSSKNSTKIAVTSSEVSKANGVAANAPLPVQNRLPLMPFAPNPIQNTSAQNQQKTVKQQHNASQPPQANASLPKEHQAAGMLSQVSGISPFGQQQQTLNPISYPSQSFNVQNPQFAKNFMTTRFASVPSHQVPELHNVTSSVSQSASMQHALNQGRLPPQRTTQTIPQSPLLQQTMAASTCIQQNIMSKVPQRMHLQQAPGIGHSNISIQQQNHNLSMKQSSIMQNSLRTNGTNAHNQIGITGSGLTSINTVQPLTTYQNNPQQGTSLANMPNNSLSPTDTSTFQVNFNQNVFGQNTFNHLPQKQLSPTMYNGLKSSDMLEFPFPGQISAAKSQQQQTANNYPIFHNYDTIDFGLWKETQPPQPPVAWWGPASRSSQIHNKDTSMTNTFQNWTNSSNLGNIANTMSVAPNNNYQQSMLHGRQFESRNNLEDARPFEQADQKPPLQTANTGNTYSLFSGNTWGSGSQASNTTNQDQMKARLNQQSLWSGPGPSPLERLLEQQKSLREGGT